MQTFTSQKTITSQNRQVYSGDKSSFVDLLAPIPSTLNSDIVELWDFDTNVDEFSNYRVVGKINGAIGALDLNAIVGNDPSPIVAGLIGNASAPDISDGHYHRGSGLYNIPNFFLNANEDSVSYVTRMKFNSTGLQDWFSIMSYGRDTSSRVFAFYIQNQLQELALEISPDGSATTFYTQAFTFNVDEWYQIGFSYNRTTHVLTFNVNGVDIATFTGVVDYFDAQEVFLIGNYYDDPNVNNDGNLDGLVDESLLYRKALTENEFATLWNNGAPTAYPFSGSPASTLSCYLRPLNEQQSADNGVQFGLGFSVIVECEVDLREGDKITIDGTEYTIRGVVNHDRGTATRYKRALALKGEKQ